MPDRIEAGSYACAAGLTGGSIELVGARPHDMLAITNGLAAAGLAIEFTEAGMKVTAHQPLKPLAISTAPYPGFPTDMQAQFMAMLAVADGQSFLEETIFETGTCTFRSCAVWAPTSRSMAARQSSRVAIH
jgi:UDP-N-acetylglucosamine 1-carboxyvinyltransferase